ncbi:hypothetical protein KUTeg_021517 [Tegillarca granosa]|uniref:Uncharacterized protein n=1 Tax=Tegillarca granosa TaxID=220873 RepID=A0ABQ9E9L9_TEGGR|nr:hypothetical protein KUTeg_021517 [Tegillarca granosa]
MLQLTATQICVLLLVCNVGWSLGYFVADHDSQTYMYWTDDASPYDHIGRYIRKIRKDDYAAMSWMSSTSSFGSIYSIDVYPPDTQPIHSICLKDNGDCDEFCMPTGTTTRTCYCDGGIGLTYNNFYNSECKASSGKISLFDRNLRLCKWKPNSICHRFELWLISTNYFLRKKIYTIFSIFVNKLYLSFKHT